LRFEREFAVKASRARVWDFIMDFEASSRCFPGVESFARLPDGRFEGVINVSVGPLKASLRGHAWFVESVAPERFAAVARVCDPLTRSDISVEVDGTNGAGFG